MLHPDQFVVLSSKSRKIAATSRKILDKHALAFDLMGLPRSPWALMNIHGGLGDRTESLVRSIERLPDAVRSRLTLENDEYTYGAAEILDVCHRTGVPFVFDCHHHVDQGRPRQLPPPVLRVLHPRGRRRPGPTRRTSSCT